MSGVVVEAYDPRWPIRFEWLRAEYRTALERAAVPIVAIEHVGSTSVPGLPAKPIIDVDIVVDERSVAPAAVALEGLGFEPQGDLGVPQRWAFQAPEPYQPTHTYIVEVNSLPLRNHLAVRDLLRARPDLKAEYGWTMRQLAAAASDRDAYQVGKSDIIHEILRVAGFNDEERSAIDQVNR